VTLREDSSVLTNLKIRNFKRFSEVDVELGDVTILIGPNNSGKTSALQALALWHVGLQRWLEKRGGKQVPKKRTGVAINRRDLIALPVPAANLLWKDLHVRNVQRLKKEDGTPETKTQNVRVDIIAQGVVHGREWTCGLEFDYANEESIYCRPLRPPQEAGNHVEEVVEEARSVRVAFLPPMSGLAANETRLDDGAVNVRIGEGRTAEVLRNLCYRIFAKGEGAWRLLNEQIHKLFGVRLEAPEYISERGEITMSYSEDSGKPLDLSCAGRGVQQVLLLLASLYENPNSVLLLDEPDAHLEILRQRQIYQLISQEARARGSQIVAASHSEVILNEAADRDVVVAFVGKPHRIDDRGTQVAKSLKQIGFEHYYLAEQKGFVLYVEGSTDLAILKAFARSLDHAAAEILETAFVHYVGNQPPAARGHFYGMREAVSHLVGFALFDRLDRDSEQTEGLVTRQWKRKEIENYLCQKETLLAHAESFGSEQAAGELWEESDRKKYRTAMEESIREIEAAHLKISDQSVWSPDTKVSGEFLDPLFRDFFKRLGIPNLMRKADYHVLAGFVPQDLIDAEVTEVLDDIVRVAKRARPRMAEE
jgi:ABC-type lipoprotein export system ATPase subunit